MADITLGQIAEGLGVIVAILGGYGVLYKKISDSIETMIGKQLEPIISTMEDLDLETCKNFLVRCIADIERGDKMSETEVERFWEQYEHYTKKGGNSYIKEKIEKLKASGKL